MTIYELISSDQGEAIHCFLCDTVSSDPYDVTQRHCRKCRRYHHEFSDLGARLLIESIAILRPDLTQPEQERLVLCLLDHCDPKVHPRIEPQPAWSDEFTGKAM